MCREDFTVRNSGAYCVPRLRVLQTGAVLHLVPVRLTCEVIGRPICGKLIFMTPPSSYAPCRKKLPGVAIPRPCMFIDHQRYERIVPRRFASNSNSLSTTASGPQLKAVMITPSTPPCCKNNSRRNASSPCPCYVIVLLCWRRISVANVGSHNLHPSDCRRHQINHIGVRMA